MSKVIDKLNKLKKQVALTALLLTPTVASNAQAQNNYSDSKDNNNNTEIKAQMVEQDAVDVDGALVYYGGIASFRFGIGDKGLKVQHIDNNGEDYYIATSDSGIVYMNNKGNGFCAKINEQDNAEYFKIVDGVKTTIDELQGKSLAEDLVQQYGNDNSSLQKMWGQDLVDVYEQFKADAHKAFDAMKNVNDRSFDNSAKENRQSMEKTRQENTEKAANNPNARVINVHFGARESR